MRNQQTIDQHWLSLDGICTKLRLTKGCVLALAKKGCIGVIWGPPNQGKNLYARFLDPTPEYAERLRLGAIIHQRNFPVPEDLSERSLFTMQEAAAILGWTHKATKIYFGRNNLPYVKAGVNLFLYSAATLRDVIWKENRSTANQRSPYLLTELIEFFKRWYAEETEGVPTDQQYLVDDEIQRRLSKIVSRAEDGQRLGKADFASKVALAQKIVQILESAKTPRD